MSPRRDRDVIRLPDPEHQHPLADLDPGKARKRRRAAPGPEDPRDEAMMVVIGRIQQLNGQVVALANELKLARLEIELHRRRIVALEMATQARQEPAGAVHAPGADRSDVPTSRTP